MKSQQALVTEQFYKFEKEHKLFDLKIQNCYVWEPIRFKIWQQLLVQKKIINQPHDTINENSDQLIRIPWLFKSLTSHNPFFSSKTDILFVGHARRKKLGDNLWWDIYTDPIVDAIAKSVLVLEKPHLGKHAIPAKTNLIKYLDLLQTIATILSKIFPIYLFPSEKTLLAQISNHFIKTFKIKAGYFDLAREVNQYFSKRKYSLIFYQQLFKQIQPKALVLTVYYCNQFLIEAARLLNIPVIELQHGVISKYHIAYNYPKLNRLSSFVPDRILTFGDCWNELIKLPVLSSDIIATGYPFFEMQRKRYSNLSRKKQVLFLSQGSIGRDLAVFASHLVKKLPSEYKLIYKLHPGEFKRNYPCLTDNNITIIREEIPLYQLLAESEIQIGVNSTALFEGIGMGIKKTGIVQLEGFEHMMSHLNDGTMTLLSNPADFEKLLLNQYRNENYEDLYFKKKAIQNIKNELSINRHD
jgi:hypothetical protein